MKGFLKEEGPGYLFAYFRSGPGRVERTEKLHYALSRDGLQWYELNNNEAIWTSSLGEGILRDPFIGKCPDGKWRMVFTIRPAGTKIGYAESEDLITWTNERELEVMANYKDVHHSWAPEFTYDAEQGDYLIYWCSSLNNVVSNNKHYCARTRDWNSFTPAKLFFDPDYQTIDATIEQYDGKYYMFYKDETFVYDKVKQPHPPANKLAISDKLEGPYEVISDFITPDYTEGPEVLRLYEQKKWYLYYDFWKDGKYGIMESTDLKNWKLVPEDQYRFPYQRRHGTFFRVTEAEFNKLLMNFN